MPSSVTEVWQPELRLRDHAWRTAAVLGMSALTWQDVAVAQWQTRRELFWIDVALGVGSLVLVFWRRRWPFGVALLTTLANAGSATAAGPAALALVSLATHRRLVPTVVVSAAGVCVAMVFGLYQPTTPDSPSRWFDYAGFTTVTAAIAAAGMFIGSRRELLWTLRDRAERAESEQALRVAQARVTERARIAREMHDVLAHRMSLVSMHAGALAYRDDLTEQQVKATAEVIQLKAHEALADLRHVLGVLQDGRSERDRPQPTYADVPGLVDEANQAGMHVVLDAAEGITIPEHIGRTVYRVVQEGLTNARRHAPSPDARVRVAPHQNGVMVTVWNPSGSAPAARTPAPGTGLVGLTERVEVAHGCLRYGADDTGFTLTAWLPVDG